MSFWSATAWWPLRRPLGLKPRGRIPQPDPLRSTAMDRLAPSGCHFELSLEAFELFAALRESDAHEAMFRAFRLRRIAHDADFPDAQDAAEALEVALLCCSACNSPPVQRASVELVRTMVLDGLIHWVAANHLDARDIGTSRPGGSSRASTS